MHRDAIVMQSRRDLRRRAITGFFAIARYRSLDCYSAPLSRATITMFYKQKVGTNNLQPLLFGKQIARKGDRETRKKGVQRTVSANAADQLYALGLSLSIERH